MDGLWQMLGKVQNRCNCWFRPKLLLPVQKGTHKDQEETVFPSSWNVPETQVQTEPADLGRQRQADFEVSQSTKQVLRHPLQDSIIEIIEYFIYLFFSIWFLFSLRVQQISNMPGLPFSLLPIFMHF